MSDLQLRLQEPDTTVANAVRQCGLTPEERIVARLREIEAQIKTLETEKDAIKAEIREGVKDGVVYGSTEIGGYYTLESRNSERFDWKKAAMSGLFTLDQAAPFIKRTTSEALVFKRLEREEK